MSEKTPYEITPLAEDQPRGWTLTIDGEEVQATQFSLVNERFGSQIDYGLRQEGYDGFVIRERGGAVTLPYMMSPDGQILVGLVDEYRPTTGQESTLNAPRGMANIGETREQTGLRELEEETGYSQETKLGMGAMRAVELATDVSANSTYFDTSRPVNEGTAFFALEVPSDHLELSYAEDGTLFYAFPERLVETAEDKETERIFGSKFVPLYEALKSKDMFTGYAVGQLLGKLLEDGNYIVPQTRQARKSSA